MVRELVSRRAVVASTGLSVALAGCLADGSCETVVDETETVERNGIRVYDADATAGQRLYVRLRRIEGPPARVSVFDPAEEPLLERQDVDRIERIVEIADAGVHSVVTQNNSSSDTGRWLTTVAVYQGWCSDIF